MLGMYFEKYCHVKIPCSYEEQLLVIKLTHLLLKEMNYETLEALQEGERRGAPASSGRRGAYSSVGEPGNCCPSVIQRHKSKSLRVCRLLHPLVPAPVHGRVRI